MRITLIWFFNGVSSYFGIYVCKYVEASFSSNKSIEIIWNKIKRGFKLLQVLYFTCFKLSLNKHRRVTVQTSGTVSIHFFLVALHFLAYFTVYSVHIIIKPTTMYVLFMRIESLKLVYLKNIWTSWRLFWQCYVCICFSLNINYSVIK